MPFRFTIVGDGDSDAALKPIVEWLLSKIDHVSTAGYLVEFTTGRHGRSRFDALAGKLDVALREFPADLVFVHRDAERDPPERRFQEIDSACRAVGVDAVVPVVPVRMTEAWLLIDEAALRRAAGNPNGHIRLSLPAISKLESLPDPKQVCNELMVRATESTGRRRDKFNRDSELAWRRVRLAEIIRDFAPALAIDSFRRFYEAGFTACESLTRRSAE